jgi:hypothetical protein
MDGILICTALLIAIVLLSRDGQDSDTLAYAPVHQDPDDTTTFAAICGSSLMMHESPVLPSDDDWPTSSAVDDSFVTSSYGSGTSTDSNRWMDPMYAYEFDNMYHNTPLDPTYHDDSFSNSSGYDDSFSTSSFDDSCSGSSFDDSFSSSSSFDD